MTSSDTQSQSDEEMTAMGGQKRYDRQIRIWGPHGQALLERSTVCVLGAGPTATETLKSLVLGGIASFTVVDNLRVTGRDLGNNFFFDQSSLNKGRAEVAVGLLREMNDSVQGSFVDMDIESVLKSEPAIVKDFDLVVACEVR
jgi:NEDD8-activating enzyme E1 regulatory subunit